MKKIHVMVVVIFVFVPLVVKAQESGSENKTPGLKDKFYFGANVLPGFGKHFFDLEIAPFVGYKFNSKFSAGIRVPLEYRFRKAPIGNGRFATYKKVDYGIGMFGRYKFSKNLFAIAEYNHLWHSTVKARDGSFFDPNNPGRILTQRFYRDEFNLGIGITTKGKWGFEMAVLYNVLAVRKNNYVPINLKMGLNYRF